MDYTTQMDAARKGIHTPEMKEVAENEQMDLDILNYDIVLYRMSIKKHFIQLKCFFVLS